ncbi:MAG: Ig-like domain-containing protein [Candidatus Bathyarchaeia archaeon]
MNREKRILSLIVTSILLISTLVVCVPMARSGSFREETNQYFYGIMTPQLVTAGYDGKQVKFQFSITSNTTEGTAIDCINVTLPLGWEAVSVECNATWTFDNQTSYVKFNATFDSELTNGTKLFFNITARVLVGVGKWTIECYDDMVSLGSVTEKVVVTPYFDAEISPAVVKSGYTYVFVLTVTHNTTLSSIYQVVVRYPSASGWVFSDIVSYPQYWIFSHDPVTREITFTATGGNLISPGRSATFSIAMTLNKGALDGTWAVTAVNTANQQATIDLTVDVDDDAPIVRISTPEDNARVCGNVWINASISDDNLQSWAIKINGTQVATGTTATVAYRWDTLTYADGLYTINVTAVDVVGNIGYNSVTVTVDNTPPQLIEIKVKAYRDSEVIGEYKPIGDTIWIPNATGIRVYAAFYDTGTFGAQSYVYFNVSAEAFGNATWLPGLAPYDVSRVTSLPVKINITDDLGNRFVGTWYVRKDLNPPSVPTYTKWQLICGGIIIWGLNATDAESTVVGYNIYVNTTRNPVTTSQLASTVWTNVTTNLYSFSGAVIIDLTGAKYANISVAAVDGAGNERVKTVYVGAIPSGTWYPIELYPGWNLISLPLVPNSTARADIYALILKQGAASVQFTYTFDNQAKQWTLNPATLTHGKGYWLKLNAYDVLIVQGTPKEDYWSLEPIYYLLYKGWNLVGYTEMDEYSASWYLSSLQERTYFRYLFVWNAQSQRWFMVDTIDTKTLTPGQAFWILLYEDQTLVPPVPSP